MIWYDMIWYCCHWGKFLLRISCCMHNLFAIIICNKTSNTNRVDLVKDFFETQNSLYSKFNLQKHALSEGLTPRQQNPLWVFNWFFKWFRFSSRPPLRLQPSSVGQICLFMVPRSPGRTGYFILINSIYYTYFQCVFVITLVTVTMLIIQGEELNGEGSEKYEILDSQVSYLIAA